MKFKIPDGLTKVMAHKSLLAQKHSPTVLLAAGIVGVVGSTVLACRATLKLDDVLQKDLDRVADIKATEHPDYSDKDRTKDLATVYTRAAVNITKAYAPAFTLGVISVGCIVGSHRILSSRNAGLVAAYGVLEKGYNEYRDRVISELGEDKEKELRYGTEVVNTLGEDGKVRSELKTGKSIYARFFDESSRNWNKTPAYNQMFLRSQQNYANDLLKSRGHLFLNEVYDMLGLERSPEGSQVGWFLDDTGDSFVDFMIFDGDSYSAQRFVNLDEASVFLDFNVDGVIWDKI